MLQRSSKRPQQQQLSLGRRRLRDRVLLLFTLPGLALIIILLFILRLGDSLTVGFEQIIPQQQAVGRDVSEVLDTYVYTKGVLGGAWGVAAAVGLVKGIVGVILVLTANKVAHIFGEQGCDPDADPDRLSVPAAALRQGRADRRRQGLGPTPFG